MKTPFRLFPKKYGNFPLFWLIYLAFPLYGIFQEEAIKALLGFALIGLLVFIYRESYWRPRFNTLHLIIELMIVVTFCIGYNPMFIYLGFYPVNLLGLVKDIRKHILSVVLLTAIFIATVLYHKVQIGSVLFISIFAPYLIMALTPFAIRVSIKNQELQDKLEYANKRIDELIKREERQRIARDLHDTLGHTLSLITLKSELVEKLIKKNPDQALVEIREIKDTSRVTLKQVRELVADMNSVTISEELEHARSILTAANIELTVLGDIQSIHTTKLNENILGMCLREAVTNVVKHSKATKCVINFHDESGSILVRIKDNGRGLDKSQNHGNGLHGMIERLRFIEGTVTLEGNKGEGTSLLVSIPKVVRKHVETTM